MAHRERPILFNTEMVKAIMAGLKTQTRRLRGLNKINDLIKKGEITHIIPSVTVDELPAYVWLPYNGGAKKSQKPIKSPYGQRGDLLWVRETFLKLDKDHVITRPYAYKADADENTEELRHQYISQGRKYRWKPSIHMPKNAARIWLLVKDVSLSRLNNLTLEDALDEGIARKLPNSEMQPDPIDSFKALWESINGPGSWKENPLVWVVEFKVLSTDGKPNTWTGKQLRIDDLADELKTLKTAL